MSTADAVAHTGLGLALMGPLAVRRAESHGKDARRLAWTLVAVLVTVAVLQAILMRPRPFGGPLFVGALPFYSFPSGHVAARFATATFVVLWRPRGLVAAVALPIASAVAIGRVWSGNHFPSDVVAGAAIGIGFAVAGFGVFRTPSFRPNWSWLLFPVLSAMTTMGAWATAGLGSVEQIFFASADKAIHFAGFGAMSFLAVSWLRAGAAGLATLAAATLLEEGSQSFWPARTVDPLDAVASVAGVLLFGGCAMALRRR